MMYFSLLEKVSERVRAIRLPMKPSGLRTALSAIIFVASISLTCYAILTAQGLILRALLNVLGVNIRLVQARAVMATMVVIERLISRFI